MNTKENTREHRSFCYFIFLIKLEVYIIEILSLILIIISIIYFPYVYYKE